ncbi:PIN domain-containing protein [Limnochorda pilosa]|uniref:PIN domain-containing protein n=1 Tax=Limnochorda pilosa TaxID=1555112 RepID=UPI00082B5C94|nr:PIN domain-containing protein [Limnochorda pilosa]
MKYLLLDTNVFVACTRMRIGHHDAGLLGRLRQALEAGAARLLLPEIVVREYWREEAQTFQDARRDKNDVLKAIGDLYSRRKPPQALIELIENEMTALEQNRKAAHEVISEIFQAPYTVKVPLTPAIVFAAFQRTADGRRPANPDVNYLLDADAVIVESVAAYHRDHGDLELVLCTEDADYFEGDALHPEIAQDLAPGTRIYNSLADVVRQELDTTVSREQEEAYLKGSLRVSYAVGQPSLLTDMFTALARMRQAQEQLSKQIVGAQGMRLDALGSTARSIGKALEGYNSMVRLLGQRLAEYHQTARMVGAGVVRAAEIARTATDHMGPALQGIVSAQDFVAPFLRTAAEIQRITSSVERLKPPEEWLEEEAAEPEPPRYRPPFHPQEVEEMGFEGFVKVRRFQRFDHIPPGPGAYVVLRESAFPPEFLPTSPAGRPNGKDPTLPVERLEKLWVEGTYLLYIGESKNLPGRVKNLVRFAQGRPAPHWKGRAVWQLKDHADLLVAWMHDEVYHTVPYRDVLQAFREAYGQLPFGNQRVD